METLAHDTDASIPSAYVLFCGGDNANDGAGTHDGPPELELDFGTMAAIESSNPFEALHAAYVEAGASSDPDTTASAERQELLCAQMAILAAGRADAVTVKSWDIANIRRHFAAHPDHLVEALQHKQLPRCARNWVHLYQAELAGNAFTDPDV